MITTKKLNPEKNLIHADTIDSYHVQITCTTETADYAAIAEINGRLSEAAKNQKQINAEAKHLSSVLYAGI